MKSKLLLLLLLTFLFSCKKEEIDISSSNITINYKVGDHFTYKREIVDYKTDTFEILITKDTIINNKNCLVYIKREKGFKDDITYLEQTDSSINAIGYWDGVNNIVKTLDTPKLMYLNPIKYGTNWLTFLLSDTSRMTVKATELIKIENHYFPCMKIIKSRDISKKDDYSTYSYTEYLDTKGLVYSKEFFKTVYSFENGVPIDSSSLTFELRRISK